MLTYEKSGLALVIAPFPLSPPELVRLTIDGKNDVLRPFELKKTDITECCKKPSSSKTVTSRFPPLFDPGWKDISIQKTGSTGNYKNKVRFGSGSDFGKHVSAGEGTTGLSTAVIETVSPRSAPFVGLYVTFG